MARHSVVFSNVRGPDAAACFANARLRGLSMVFSNPLPQVGVLTYNGRVHFTFTLDADATVAARDLYAHEDLGVFAGSLRLFVNIDGVRALRLSPVSAA